MGHTAGFPLTPPTILYNHHFPSIGDGISNSRPFRFKEQYNALEQMPWFYRQEDREVIADAHHTLVTENLDLILGLLRSSQSTGYYLFFSDKLSPKHRVKGTNFGVRHLSNLGSTPNQLRRPPTFSMPQLSPLKHWVMIVVCTVPVRCSSKISWMLVNTELDLVRAHQILLVQSISLLYFFCSSIYLFSLGASKLY